MDQAAMHRLRRAEFDARRSAIDALIEDQRVRNEQRRAMGWETTLSEDRLRLLVKARELHSRAFAAAYGKAALDDQADD